MNPGEIEGVGDALTGGIVARQLEPAAGEAHGDGPAASCLNCGAALAGPYCHRCGQAGRVHRNLAAFWHDLAHGVLHLEGKIWRTLPLLAWRPGALTRRYVDGERARFVSPMALFLFSVFLMASVIHLVGPPIHAHPRTIHDGKVLQGPALEAELARAEARLASLEADRARLVAARSDTKGMDARITDARSNRDGLRTGAALARGFDARNLNLSTGLPGTDRAVRSAQQNPELIAYRIQTNAYKFSWALVPISLPFIWLMFAWRRDVTMFDHAVFATYSLCAMTLLVVGLSLAAVIGVPEALIGAMLLLVPPIHMYRQLRGTYSLSWPGALWRTLALLIVAFASVVLFLFLLALGAAG